MKTSEKLKYIFDKINWGTSFLDADAVCYMNEIGGEIKEMEKKLEIIKEKVSNGKS